jgi:hypothetical protein
MGQPVSTESIESIARRPSAGTGVAACAACGAPLADDQRYCLQCGERATPISSVLAGPPPPAGAGGHVNGPLSPPSALAPPGAAPPSLPGPPDDSEAAGRGNAVTVIAGVGVLLLAMGIGVLIGRSGAAKPAASAAPPQVISLSTAPAAATPPSATSKSPVAGAAHGGAGAGGRKGASGRRGGKSGIGSSPSNPAPPSSVESLKGKSGKSYEQESKNLPDVVSTG